MRDARRRFSVRLAWGTSLSHRWSGKSLSHVANPAMKWFLNVLIARSAALLRWMYGGANSNVASSSTMNSLSALEHSLSSFASLGDSPDSWSVRNTMRYPDRIAGPVLSMIGMLSTRLLS